VWELADIRVYHTVLEPSAGRGALAEHVAYWTGAELYLIEQDEHELKHAKAAVAAARALGKRNGERPPEPNYLCTDFLSIDPHAWPIDRIIMNPPFARGAYIKHIMHAWACLHPGGRLVAIVPSTWKTLTTKAAQAFRAELEPCKVQALEQVLPADTFAESGAQVNTVILVFDKPKLGVPEVMKQPHEWTDANDAAFWRYWDASRFSLHDPEDRVEWAAHRFSMEFPEWAMTTVRDIKRQVMLDANPYIARRPNRDKSECERRFGLTSPLGNRTPSDA
jgi:hypothetical protein